jgi:hypothetical protein
MLHILTISVKHSLQWLTNNVMEINLNLVEEYLLIVKRIEHYKYLVIHVLDDYIQVEPYMID